MGMIVGPHEVYFGSFFDRFNVRFGPAHPGGTVWQGGGIDEIAALQRQFAIFRKDRPFLESAALLGLTGTTAGPGKDRWLEYLGRLPRMVSDDPDLSGDARIVSALTNNLALPSPLPCHMAAHDGRLREPGVVVVGEGEPVFYLGGRRFLTIHLPMRPNG